MKMNVQIFSHPLFGDIRVAGTFMEPLFCLVDVCNALDIKNPSRAKTALKPGGVHQMKVTTTRSSTSTSSSCAPTSLRLNPSRTGCAERCCRLSARTAATS